MILLDGNVLVYAHRAETERHEQCRSWLDENLTRRSAVWCLTSH